MFKFKINGAIGASSKTSRIYKLTHFMSASAIIDFGFKQGFKHIKSIDYYSDMYKCWLHEKNL